MGKPADEDVFGEAGRLIASRETPRVRAKRLLKELLPSFTSRDEAMNHLYYFTHNDAHKRLLVVAAALYIMGTDED